ncbi:DUF4138 domain-containing protein [Aquimarina sp. MMG016]|uniref:DUF4138 domain-containing protein n=1 Tax=Aquimarina sp. MMG016 TaxID=2822690 RepID=UPI001B3A5B80|nr:DUF4138 domain-containing protein [Aquimarina sp. MMG016]MBQ4820592.1 DUF4138 domain-containing protein [Aquimarina sp. MMG016]
MKKSIYIIALLLISNYTLQSQTNLTPITYIDTLQVSDIKTTHLLFDDNIKYLDLGSPYFVADTLQQMVKLKHIGEELIDPKSQLSNLTVITDKGNYYSITLRYERYANLVTYVVKESDQIVPSYREEIETVEKKTGYLQLLCSKMEHINSNVLIKNKKGQDLNILVNGIFYNQDKIGIRIKLQNTSTIDFDIDQILFRTKLDKRISADYLYQERVINPIHTCNTDLEITGEGNITVVLLFDKFMLNKKEKLSIDVFEKNGGRSAIINIPRKTLLKPRII